MTEVVYGDVMDVFERIERGFTDHCQPSDAKNEHDTTEPDPITFPRRYNRIHLSSPP
ncbi:hypothetical protein LTR16_007661, partial [Cryomyces antarcticus]